MAPVNPHLDESNRIYEDRIIDMARRANRVSSPRERFIASQANRRQQGLGSFEKPNAPFRRMRTAAQTEGPAGMGMNAYVNRPETGGLRYALNKLLRNKQWEQIQAEQRRKMLKGLGGGTPGDFPGGGLEVNVPLPSTEDPESIWTNLGSKIRNVGGALADEFGGSAMAGELMDMRDLRGQEKFSAEDLRNLGLSGSDEGALADENLVSGGIGQDARSMQEDAYEQAVGPRNFVDPEMSSLVGRDVRVNYPGHYRITPGVMESCLLYTSDAADE